jgi:hypothetical protein
LHAFTQNRKSTSLDLARGGVGIDEEADLLDLEAHVDREDTIGSEGDVPYLSMDLAFHSSSSRFERKMLQTKMYMKNR